MIIIVNINLKKKKETHFRHNKLAYFQYINDIKNRYFIYLNNKFYRK